MKNLLAILAVSMCATMLPGTTKNAKADKQQMQQLVPDVPYVRKDDRTHVFSRSQLIYSLGANDYLHHWVDRPLMVNPSLDANNVPPALMSLPAYEEMQKTSLETGLDGFSFFPQTSRRAPFYDYARRSTVKDFHLLTEFVSSDQDTTKDDSLKMALENPASFRINGKVVVTSYRADGKTPEYWQSEIARLKAKFGDTFLFLPDVILYNGVSPNTWADKYHHNQITQKDIDSIKEYLRQWARATDGLYCAYAAGFQADDGTFDADFYQNFVIRLMKSVLAEPEFKGKYFGLSAVVGHENCTRFGFTLSSDATKTLRHSMETAMSANPDVINIPEWDEQNENTSLRPTVYNGFSSMRIMRYYTDKLKGQNPAPLPGDDTSIPDLIVTYRKVLTLGEKVEVELLNVPDSAKGTSYTARLILENGKGETVFTSPIQTLNSGQMKADTVEIPSEQLAADQVLRPKIEVDYNGHKSTFEDGLQYILLRSTWNWDYKWVKQPLRDLLKPQQENFEVSAPDAEGLRTVKASFTAKEPLRYVEVLDNDDTVYSYSADDKWRENADQIIVRLAWTSFGGRSSGLKLDGKISLQNSQGRWLVGQSFYDPVLTDQTLSFAGKSAASWRMSALVAIPRADIGKAVFDVEMPGIYTGKIAVKDLMANSIYGISGPMGFNLIFSHYVDQDHMPRNVNDYAVKFEVPILPRMENSVIHLQAIGKSGRLYRSKPILLGNISTNKSQIAVFSDTANKRVDLSVDANRVPDINYNFSPSTHGCVLTTDAGRPFWATLGGYFAQVTGRGGGNAGDDSPFISGRGFPKNATHTAPDWVKTEDGKDALQFDGKSTFISLPQGVIPDRAAFIIDMDIKPDNATGKQLIIANRSYYPGSLSVFSDNGELKVDYLGYNDSKTSLDCGIALPAGKWSHLQIRYDQKNLVISVDNKASQNIIINGPGRYTTASVVGGWGEDWFKGEIKSLRIRHLAGDIKWIR